jgi:hypothetical protein
MKTSGDVAVSPARPNAARRIISPWPQPAQTAAGGPCALSDFGPTHGRRSQIGAMMGRANVRQGGVL